MLVIVIGLVAYAPLVWADILSNRIACWEFNEGTGATVNDSCANALHLGHGGTWTLPGKVGAAAGHYVAASNQQSTLSITTSSPLWPNTGNWSAAAWAKRAATGALHGIGGNLAGDNLRWFWRFNANNTMTAAFNAIEFVSTGTVTDTNWHHVAFSATRAGNIVFYIDGVSAGSTSMSSLSGSVNNPATITWGLGRVDSTIQHMDGDLDDVWVWARALTQADIQEHMARATVSSRRRIIRLE